jgi:hypothetical protein
MKPRLNLLIIDFACSTFHEGDVNVMANIDFATTNERDAYIEDFARERELTVSELLDNGYVVVAQEWAR